MDTSSLRSTDAHVFVAADDLRRDGDLLIDDDVEHHLRRVLRLRDGATVSATDGEGAWRLTTVAVAGNSLRLVPTTDVHHEPRPTAISVAAAMPKGDRLEWMVQKVTELGADRLTLLHAEHSVVRWKPAKVESALARLRRIADEACRQSRRTWRMSIDGPVDASAVLGEHAVAEPGGRALAEGDRAVAVGPEGGWSDAELALAADTVSLGRHVLRTETAAVAAVALCVALDR